MNFIAKIKVFDKPQPVQEIDGVRFRASQYHYNTISAGSFESARHAAEKVAQGKPIIFIGKPISKTEARKKYGISTTGVNSFYDYYLLDDGKIVDDDGDIRYSPPLSA